MGAAFFVVLERKIDGLDAMMDGKAISRSSEILDSIATQIGVRSLSEFISIDPGQAADFLAGEGTDVDGLELPPLCQFSASDGLASVRALMAQVQKNSDTVKDADWIIQDFRDCERILSEAEKNRVGWHFEVDF